MSRSCGRKASAHGARLVLAVSALVGSAALSGWATAGAAEPDRQPVTLAAAPHPTADLYPGGVGSAQFTINNPNGTSLQLTSVSFGDVSSSDPSVCSGDYLRPVSQTLPLRARVPEHATGLAQVVPGAFLLSDDAPDGCQGVTFTVDTTVSGVAEGAAELPNTGVDTVGLTITAAALVGAGAAISWRGRRRSG